jgi:anti-sigma28 factor (negative regulator of flagellin synthesis)
MQEDGSSKQDMNDTSTGAAGNQQVGQRPFGADGTGAATAREDVHLTELVRSLRSLAADSPERQALIERLALAHARGRYRVDAEATAAAIINDAETGGGL